MTGADTKPPASLAILAGGHSTRLGQDKSQVLLGGIPLLLQVARRVAPLTDDLMVVLRADQRPPNEDSPVSQPWRIVRDWDGHEGLIAGLASALLSARYDLVWVVGCDMPFLSPALLQRERAILGGWDAVVPRVTLGLEPLHAVYHRRCAGALLAALTEGSQRVGGVLSHLRVRYVDCAEMAPFGVPERLFFNINTPGDLTEAEHMLVCD
jgi:molybdopterin-guanine dinucleotide biosynthesis protein A